MIKRPITDYHRSFTYTYNYTSNILSNSDEKGNRKSSKTEFKLFPRFSAQKFPFFPFILLQYMLYYKGLGRKTNAYLKL